MSNRSGVIGGINKLSDLLGQSVSWLVLLMTLIVGGGSVLRYGFSIEIYMLRETATWLNAVIIMLAASYTLRHNRHTRVNVVYYTKSEHTKALIDALGVVLFLFPFVAMVGWLSWPHVYESWQMLGKISSLSDIPGHLILQTLVLVFCVTLGLQGAALAGQSFSNWRMRS